MKVSPFLIVVLCMAGSTSLASDEFELWLDASVSGKLTDQITLKVNEQFKFKDDASDFANYHTDIGITYRGNTSWKVGLNLRQEFEKKNGEWLDENRLHTHLTYTWTWHQISFSDRNRLELRLRESRKDIVRYRNKLTATFPVTFGPGMKPYLSEELFVDSDAGELTRSRLAAGLKTKLNHRTNMGMYYIWEANNKSSWISSHIAGLNVGLVF